MAAKRSQEGDGDIVGGSAGESVGVGGGGSGSGRRLGAVDIGSNAARLLICDADGDGGLKKVVMVRMPLRLGAPVFSRGEIGAAAGGRLIECMRAFRWLFRSQGTDAVCACATSAMREASDGAAWALEGGEALGAEIRIIGGREEAGLLARSVARFTGKGAGILADVGGGSADVCAFRTGDSRESGGVEGGVGGGVEGGVGGVGWVGGVGVEVLEAESFGLGAVRLLEGGVSEAEWGRFGEWMEAAAERYGVSELTACGGNIRRLGKLLDGRINLEKLESLRDELSGMTKRERMLRYDFRSDRADVIVPAAEIYCAALRAGNFTRLKIPPAAGLADGIIRQMAGESQ